MRLKWVRALLAVVLGSVVLSGCDFDVYKLPLPGGADVGSKPITVTVMFTDVLDLVPKSTVKVNDVNVGQVTDVSLDGYTAKVTLELRNDTKLPDNALAEIRQTSLLGEKFVSLAAPPEGASTNPLSTGDVIPLDRAGRNPEVEEVLGALSLVLNGGGVAQLRTIAQELNKALAGREDSARSVLDQVDQLTSTLDGSKDDIVNAIEALNNLSIAAEKQLPTIDKALEELPSALDSIDAQRAGLVKMLQSLDDLSDVGVRVIKASKDSTIQAVQQLQPVLTQLSNSGDAFVKAFNTFYAYPFVDEAVGRDPQVARNLHVGDYTNLDMDLDIDLTGILPTALPTNLPGDLINALQACLDSKDPTSQACRQVLGSTLFKDYCAKPANSGTLLCTLPGVPGLPGLPGAPSIPGLPIGLPGAAAASAQSTGGTKGGLLPGVPLASQLPIVGGLFRAGTGWAAPSPDGKGGPTLGQLQDAYNPDLVALMVPPMVSGGARQ